MLQGGEDHGVQGAVLRVGRTVQTYTETLAVIEAWPEEGGGGAVRATLLSNCATGLLKVRACSGRQRVVVLMRVGDRWTGTRRRWWTQVLGEVRILDRRESVSRVPTPSS